MGKKFSKQQLRRISETFLFQGVDELVVEQMASDDRCLQRTFEKGQVIFDETNFFRALGVLLSGEILVEKNTADGKRIKMSRLKTGECFGAAAMFHSRDRYANVLTAVKPTEVLFLPQELIAWAMRRDPEITENYIGYLSDRIWFLNGKISALTAGSAEQRLAVLLLARGKIETSMTELSRQLGVSRASLYRALASLERQGLILRGSKSIEVIDAAGLRRLTVSQ